MSIDGYLSERGWEEVAQLKVEGCEARLSHLNPDLVDPHTVKFGAKLHPGGLYLHQVEAIHRFGQGANVCLATGTSSGKTTLFHCAAVETFSKDPSAKVIYLYPLKALANEQEERWAAAMSMAAPDCRVGRISGDVPVKARAQILKQSHVVVMTPDVMHAWMLPNANDRSVRAFLQHLRLVVVDEAQAYKNSPVPRCGSSARCDMRPTRMRSAITSLRSIRHPMWNCSERSNALRCRSKKARHASSSKRL